jgi:hypothetical protein
MSDTITITDNCRICDAKLSVSVPYSGYVRWKEGEYIQHAMPAVSLDDREFLISQTCRKCFDAIWGEFDE